MPQWEREQTRELPPTGVDSADPGASQPAPARACDRLEP